MNGSEQFPVTDDVYRGECVFPPGGLLQPFQWPVFLCRKLSFTSCPVSLDFSVTPRKMTGLDQSQVLGACR